MKTNGKKFHTLLREALDPFSIPNNWEGILQQICSNAFQVETQEADLLLGEAEEAARLITAGNHLPETAAECIRLGMMWGAVIHAATLTGKKEHPAWEFIRERHKTHPNETIHAKCWEGIEAYKKKTGKPCAMLAENAATNFKIGIARGK